MRGQSCLALTERLLVVGMHINGLSTGIYTVLEMRDQTESSTCFSPKSCIKITFKGWHQPGRNLGR